MELQVAKIAVAEVNFLIDKPYSYLIPDALADQIKPGVRVLVPFGRGNKKSEGIVLRLAMQEHMPKMKYIHSVLDHEPVLGDEALRLALWMRERYFCTAYDAARAMLPTGLTFTFKERFVPAEEQTLEQALALAPQGKDAARILELVYHSSDGVERGTIYEAFAGKSPYATLQTLEAAGLIRTKSNLNRKTKDKSEVLISLAVSPEMAMESVTRLQKSAPMRYAVVEQLVNRGSLTSKELRYITGASSQTIRSLVKSGLVEESRFEVFRRTAVAHVPAAPLIALNTEQQQALDSLNRLRHKGGAQAALLYGVTGSGKTQVYLKLIRAVLDEGKTAMVLVPEIVLTPQLLQIFTAYFGDDIAVLHSSLRETERYDEWKRIRKGNARVVIGTRSAVFAPLENLGLIILDEEQEYTYKSSEHTPRYHARDVAKFRVNHHEALLLLGSATPSVETFYQAKRGVYHIVSLSKRYNEQRLPKVILADMREELKQGNETSISGPLLRELEENLRRGEQSILFLNRRGASRMVSCTGCGHVPECPNCSVKLTYHSANGRLMCHYCGHSLRLSRYCAECGAPVIFLGTGTQKLEEQLRYFFPDTPVLRMDADTINAKQSHEVLLHRFENEQIPILLGTQMVAKGLDFQNVTLVGVIDADLALYVDDFRASERTFSLLTQVVGRAGRGDKLGRAVIQTMTPENAVIHCAAVQDYDRFYEGEIALRQARGVPPFRDLFVLTVSGLDEMRVHALCIKLRQTVEGWLRQTPMDISILGPAPASVLKMNQRYRYRLILAGENNKITRSMVARLLQLAAEDRQNKGIHVFADCNPVD